MKNRTKTSVVMALLLVGLVLLIFLVVYPVINGAGMGSSKQEDAVAVAMSRLYDWIYDVVHRK